MGILLALPPAATVYLAFQAGGFFAGSTASVTVVFSLALVLRVTLAEEPFAGLGPWLLVAAGALALYAAWTLVSAAWSHAPARALLGFDRVLLYLLVLLAVGSLARTPARVAWLLRGMALAFVVICAAAFVTRTLPDVWPIAANIENGRLSYPLTYWNALGMLAGIAIILFLHLASSRSEPRTVRVAASAALPIAAVTLFFTFSRGAIAATACGLVAYLLVARPGAVMRALAAAVPTTAVAVVSAYNAGLLASDHPTTAAAVGQGHSVAVATAGCALAAALVRACLLRLGTLPRPPRPAWLGPRRAALLAIASAAFAVAVVALALNAPGFIKQEYNRFVDERVVVSDARGDHRDRLLDVSNNGRLDHWRVALDGFRANSVHGTGAGTYRLLWARHRRDPLTVNNAHSVYLETLGELGVVGLGLLLVGIVALLGGSLVRSWAERSAAAAVAFAVALAWAIHAGIDWDWQMPAVTLSVFALGGLVLAAPADARRPSWRPGRLTRLVAALGCLILAVTPVRIAASQASLDRSARMLARGNCAPAIDAALSSVGAVPSRPEPFEILGFCDMRLGHAPLGVRAFEHAVTLDPANWEYRYGLALARAAAGRDPRASARRALALNPRGSLPAAAVHAFGGTRSRRAWARAARRLPMPGSEF